jgi:hypothetical protein
MTTSFNEAWNTLREQKTYDDCIKVIFNWVKQGKITPRLMEMLVHQAYLTKVKVPEHI